MLSVESFSADERRALSPYFTNLDRPVFALVQLPEVVKGALFARYSRSAKSLRRLFLDEFLDAVDVQSSPSTVGVERAERLYERVFSEYGDDSVAQLGGVHLACEGCSNILTKVLEWGRLMAYLEQSTRYVPYTRAPDGRWSYHVPAEIAASSQQRAYRETLDHAFDVYSAWLGRMQDHLARRFPRAEEVSEGAHQRAIRAKALDAVRGLLPAATQANVGIFGTGQAYEALLLRMRAQPQAEVRQYADWMLEELRKVIPAFLRRVDQPERGLEWTHYLQATRQAMWRTASELLAGIEPAPQPEVALTEHDPDGEVKVVAAALYPVSRLSDLQLLEIARGMSAEERLGVLRDYVGPRSNRRHKPGRAFERTSYRFDVLADYGAFRDLQRHRLLTIEWQRLGPQHGYDVPQSVAEAGGAADWNRVMHESAQLYGALVSAGLSHVADYAVSMAYRVRFYVHMNAREAMHLIELRTSPQGHPAYRRICQAMRRLIAETAGHRAIAESMRFAGHDEVTLERLDAERAAERRKGVKS